MSSYCSSLSNFIIDQDPLRFGGKQIEYIQKRDEAIASQLEKLQQAIAKGQDLKKIFFETLSDFANVRHQLAVSHGTKNDYDFGRRRWDVIRDVPYSDLTGMYQAFNKKMTEYLSIMLKGVIPVRGDLTVKKMEKEETCLGRKCKFELELLDTNDLAKREWNRSVPKCITEIKQDKNLKIMPELSKVDENHFPPTPEEQVIINALKHNLKYVKQNHNAFYVHGKMFYILQGLFDTFPSATKTLIPGGGYVLKGNTDYLKNIFLHCKVRIEINQELYALSEYITWSYQDHSTDPAERIKRSIVVILHQDQFLIDDTLEEIAKIFESAMQWDSKREELIRLQEKAALIRYLFAHCMPYQRGSAAIGEWLEKLIYHAKGFACEHSNKTMGDLEAFTAPLFSSFLQAYPTTIKLSELTAVKS